LDKKQKRIKNSNGRTVVLTVVQLYGDLQAATSNLITKANEGQLQVGDW